MQDPKLAVTQALLKTLNPDTNAIKQSEQYLKTMENDLQYPFILTTIIIENDQNSSSLDFLAVLALGRYMKVYYKCLEGDHKSEVIKSVVNVFLNSKNDKVMQEIILIMVRMTIIDYPNSVLFKNILGHFSTIITSTSNLSLSGVSDNVNSRAKLNFLKLVYSCFKGIYKEKFTAEPFKKLFVELYLNIRQYIFNLLNEFLTILNELTNHIESIDNKNPNLQESHELLITLCKKSYDMKLFEIASLAFKLYRFENLNGNYNTQRDKDIIIILQSMHKAYSKLANYYVTSGLISLNPDVSLLEGLVLTINKAEKIFHHSVSDFIKEFNDCIMILDYFKSLYIDTNDNIFFHGFKVVNYQKLNDEKYLELIASSESFLRLKNVEKKLLINAFSCCSIVCENFGLQSSESDNKDGEFGIEIQKRSGLKNYFEPQLIFWLKILINQYFIIDFSDIQKFRITPDDYYTEELNRRSEDDLREGITYLIKMFCFYINNQMVTDFIVALYSELNAFGVHEQKDFMYSLKKEAFYYLITKLFKCINKDFSLKDILLNTLTQNISNMEDILLLQVVNFIHVYISHSYENDPKVHNVLFYELFKVIQSQNTKNVCISLVALNSLLTLLEFEKELWNHVEALIPTIHDLHLKVTSLNSKITIFMFYSMIVDKKYINQLWPLWNVIEHEWYNHPVDSHETLTLKSKVLDIMEKLIDVGDINYSKLDFIFSVIENSLKIEEYSEIMLLESGIVIFFKFLSKLDASQLNNNSLQNLGNIFLKTEIVLQNKVDLTLPILLIFILGLITKNEYIVKSIASIVNRNIKHFFTELKETALEYIFTLFEYISFTCKTGPPEIIIQLTQSCYEYLQNQYNTSIDNEVKKQSNKFISHNLIRVLTRQVYENYQEASETLTMIYQKTLQFNFLSNMIVYANEYIQEDGINDLYNLKSLALFEIVYLKLLLKDGVMMQFDQSMNQSLVMDDQITYLINSICNLLTATQELESKGNDYDSEMLKNIEVFFADDFFVINEMDIGKFPTLLQHVNGDNFLNINLTNEFKILLQNSELIMNNAKYLNIVNNNLKYLNICQINQ